MFDVRQCGVVRSCCAMHGQMWMTRSQVQLTSQRQCVADSHRVSHPFHHHHRHSPYSPPLSKCDVLVVSSLCSYCDVCAVCCDIDDVCGVDVGMVDVCC